MGQLIDITGKRFGRLVVLSRSMLRDENGHCSKWSCLCDCGIVKDIESTSLRNGWTTSCGCLHKERLAALAQKLNRSTAQMLGQLFGNVVVISELEQRGEDGSIQYLCRCKCEQKEFIVSGTVLRSAGKRCGCYRSLGVRKTDLSEYWIYQGMISRCVDKLSNGYADYGGRGIIVCESWRNSFDNFFEDMGKRPGKEYSLDRKDNNGNYEPKNCKWSTKLEQNQNRRPKLRLTVNLEAFSYSDAIRIAKGVNEGRSLYVISCKDNWRVVTWQEMQVYLPCDSVTTLKDWEGV